MFLGHFEHNVDEKGRLAIPARFRHELAEGLVITRGLDPCLVIYSLEGWRAISDRLRKLPLMQASARRLQRFLFSEATHVVPDKLGRIVIPQYLRDYAGLHGEVVVVGMMNWIEVWSRANWESERALAESQSAEIAEHLSDLGI